MNELIAILNSIADEARKAALRTLKKYGPDSGKKVKEGAYGHKSSIIDIEVENKIIKFVESNDLPFNIFTEEAGHLTRGYEKTLVIDPVDGSYNAENGIPFYSVSLGVLRHSLKDIEAGFVKNIPMNINYWAIRGKGAYRDGVKMRVSPGKRLFVIYMGSKASEKAYRIARESRRVRELGSASLEMIMVADGIADLFLYAFRNGGALRIVDIAASYLIVKESGGLVMDDSMEPLDMALDFKERKNVVAIADEELMKVVR